MPPKREPQARRRDARRVDPDVGTRVQAFVRGADLGPVAELLAGARDDVLRRWLEAARLQPFHTARPERAVADHVPRLFDGLVAFLRRDSPRDVDPGAPLDDPAVRAAARAHAAERFGQGLGAADVLTEFRLLRQEIGRALRDRTEGPGDVLGAELLVHDALDGATTLALAALDAYEADRRHLAAEVVRLSAEKDRALAEARLVADVGAASTQSGAMGEFLQRCAEAIVRHLDAAFARVWTLDEATQVLELQASAGMYTHLDGPHGRVPVGRYKIGLIAKKRKPHLTNRVVGDRRVVDQAWAEREGMVAFAGYPLLVGDRLLGVMALFARRPLAAATLDGLASTARLVAAGAERLRAEEALRESEARFRNMADHAPVMLWVTDPDGACTYLNAPWYAFTGQSPATGLGLGWLDAVHPDDRAASSAAFLEATRERRPFRVEYRLRRHDGAYRWALDAAAPRFGPGAGFLGYVGSVIDIDERRESEAAREALIAVIAHDLRTPLTAIKGNADLLHRDAAAGRFDAERIANRTATISSTAAVMAAQIGELLDAARLRAGEPIELVRAPTDLVALAYRVAAQVQETTTRHTVQVEPGTAELVGAWDGFRLERVLGNLLGNAVKYSPRGGDVVVALRREQHDGLPYACLDVRDGGVGIPAADMPRIFGRYQRGGNVVGRFPGEGIGLAGAKQIVEQHGGTLFVESAEGQGSTFTVRLPLERAS